jgi:hypothetical protein
MVDPFTPLTLFFLKLAELCIIILKKNYKGKDPYNTHQRTTGIVRWQQRHINVTVRLASMLPEMVLKMTQLCRKLIFLWYIGES